jgi:hypothetical protein
MSCKMDFSRMVVAYCAQSKFTSSKNVQITEDGDSILWPTDPVLSTDSYSLNKTTLVLSDSWNNMQATCEVFKQQIP